MLCGQWLLTAMTMSSLCAVTALSLVLISVHGPHRCSINVQEKEEKGKMEGKKTWKGGSEEEEYMSLPPKF